MDKSLLAVERAMVEIRRRQRRRALAGGVVGPHVEVLDVVEAAEEAGERVTVSAVAAALGIDQPRASRLVAAAVGEGWVRREADQADGRRAYLVRTAEGRALSRLVHERRQRAFDRAMADWTDAEREAFAVLLGRFVGALA
ncbi:MarR family transcriptional regulator [Saccharothrix sp. NPDC042600]|uniref:MarR family winged helix-turn-helix transcriptional regulator n=1 Tax=Saccharothrix TaxID=2071 RepID=UPI00340C9B63|nr:MarR family winged helix-turn-helix transcriptional regulator [Saccharothrix mutabilis subsp. capreolus]